MAKNLVPYEVLSVHHPGFSLSYSLNRNTSRLGNLVKRLFDIFVSMLVLVLLAPFFGVIAFAIRRNSPGPAIYRGPRMGRGGNIFNILKFRTMYETDESYNGLKVTAQNDRRITPLGQWLRDTKINELPQFWNVLKGEMSLVGPRPEDPDIAETWPEDVKEEILSVRPGITSPASVQYRNEESLLPIENVMQAYMEKIGPKKIRLDQLYVRYRSFWLDLDILLWTLLVFLPRARAYSPPEELLFLGPISRLIRRHVSWFTIDLMVTFVAIGLTGFVWRWYGPLDVGWPGAISFALGFALLFSSAGLVLGVNHITWSQAMSADALVLVPAGVLATTIALVINHILGLFPAALILVASSLAFGGFMFVRYRSRLITGLLSRLRRYRRGARTTGERVLIVGEGTTAQLAAWLLDHPENSRKYSVVGFVDDDYYKQGMRIYGAKILGTCEDIPRLVEKHEVGLILFTSHQVCTNGKVSILDICSGTSARSVVVPDMLASLNSLIEMTTVDSPVSKTSGNGKEGDELPNNHYRTQYFPLKKEAQLDELGEIMEEGDLAAAQAYLQVMRKDGQTH